MAEKKTYQYVTNSHPFATEPDGIACSDGRCIPIDSGNIDYVELMREVEAGRVMIAAFVPRKRPV